MKKRRMETKIKIDKEFWKDRFPTCSKGILRAMETYIENLNMAANTIENMSREEIVLLLVDLGQTDDYWVKESLELWSRYSEGLKHLDVKELLTFLREVDGDQ